MTVKKYASAGWGDCSKCSVNATAHKSGICQECRKALNIKLDKPVLSQKVKSRGRKPIRSSGI